MKFSSQRTFKSEIENEKFLIELVKILHYPRVTDSMRTPRALANLIYTYEHNARRKRASEVTNELSLVSTPEPLGPHQ